MSRNLSWTRCGICGGEVVLDGPTHPISPKEAGRYYEEYSSKALIVANARCSDCDAKYLAWIKCERNFYGTMDGKEGFFDLSFRSSFNDEPGPNDLPTPEKLVELHRLDCAAQVRDLRAKIEGLEKEIKNVEHRALTKQSFWEDYRR